MCDRKLTATERESLIFLELKRLRNTPPRPDLKDPPNRKWLGLDRQLPPQPEYHPDRLELHR